MKIREPNELWKTTLAQIEIKLDAPAQFKTFFSETELVQIDGNKIVIGVPNPYTADWLKMRHEKLIKDTLTYVYGEVVEPVFMVVVPKQETFDPAKEKSNQELSPLLSMENGIMGSVIQAIEDSGLNTKFSMSNFIVGNSNKIAHAAALGVVEKPGQIYNPLFIHGKTGVGKTHLAQAIGRSILERSINKKVVYTSSENFLNDMVKGIKTKTMDKFRAKYRAIDLFIIDDMQLISKWVSTQDEFFNTFNEIYNAGKQVIMIADRRPEDIKNLESRLRSRMQGGMVVDMQQADYEMRLAILQKKAESSGIDLSPRILEYIARAVTDNIRELEGALQKVALFNQMKPDGELTLEEVAHCIGKDARTKRDQIKVPTVLKQVAKAFDVKIKDLKGPRRTKDLALARQVCMYILRDEFNYKLEQVAQYLNRQDHTTVIHAIDKIKSKMMIQEAFNYQVSKIITAIQESAATGEEE